MVWVEKTDPPNVTVRGIGEFSVGDTADVDTDEAEYLVEERGDFDYVDEAEDGPADETPGQEDGPPDGHLTRYDPGDLTVDEVHQKLEDYSYEVWQLKHLLEEERSGKDRSTATEAIEQRIDELEN